MIRFPFALVWINSAWLIGFVLLPHRGSSDVKYRLTHIAVIYTNFRFFCCCLPPVTHFPLPLLKLASGLPDCRWLLLIQLLMQMSIGNLVLIFEQLMYAPHPEPDRSVSALKQIASVKQCRLTMLTVRSQSTAVEFCRCWRQTDRQTRIHHTSHTHKIQGAERCMIESFVTGP